MERKRGTSGGGFCRDVFVIWSGVCCIPPIAPGEDPSLGGEILSHDVGGSKHSSRRIEEEIPNGVKLKEQYRKLYVVPTKVGY